MARLHLNFSFGLMLVSSCILSIFVAGNPINGGGMEKRVQSQTESVLFNPTGLPQHSFTGLPPAHSTHTVPHSIPQGSSTCSEHPLPRPHSIHSIFVSDRPRFAPESSVGRSVIVTHPFPRPTPSPVIIEKRFGHLTPPPLAAEPTQLAEKRFGHLTPPSDSDDPYPTAVPYTSPTDHSWLTRSFVLPTDSWFEGHRTRSHEHTHSLDHPLSASSHKPRPNHGPVTARDDAVIGPEGGPTPYCPHCIGPERTSWAPGIPTPHPTLSTVTIPCPHCIGPESLAPGIPAPSPSLAKSPGQCTTSLYLPTMVPDYKHGVKTVWTSTSTLAGAWDCHGCSLTVINPFPPTTSTHYHKTKTISSILTVVTPFCTR